MAKKIVKKVVKKSQIIKKPTKAKVQIKKKIEKVIEQEIRQVNVAHVAKINRVVGQVGGVKRMIEEARQCVEILTQLKAARAAIKSLEAEILQTHLQEYAAQLSIGNVAQKTKKIAEIKDLFTRFE